MTAHWIVVADAEQAKILETEGVPERAREVDTLSEPRARLRERDLVTGGPGRFRDSNGMHKSHVGNLDTTRIHLKELFAKRIGDYLDEARIHGRFDRLEIVAPPEFLGMLRKELSPATERMLVSEIPKNLAHEDIHSLRQHLARLHA